MNIKRYFESTVVAFKVLAGVLYEIATRIANNNNCCFTDLRHALYLSCIVVSIVLSRTIEAVEVNERKTNKWLAYENIDQAKLARTGKDVKSE